MEGITDTQQLPQQVVSPTQVQHQVPKCQSCGAVTPWKVEPLFLPRHWIIGLLFLFAGGTGVIYLAAVGLSRKGNGRAKICPMCGGRNMWAFVY